MKRIELNPYKEKFVLPHLSIKIDIYKLFHDVDPLNMCLYPVEAIIFPHNMSLRRGQSTITYGYHLLHI